MDKKSIKDVSSSIRTAFQKANDVIRKNNSEYAVELLKGIVQKEPTFMEAREALRSQEKIKSDNLGAFAKIIANMKIGMVLTKGRSKLKKAPKEAMAIAEEALAMNLYSPPALNLLADAASEAKAFYIAVEALEIVDELQPKNEVNLRKMAKTYESNSQGREVLRVWQRISELRPGDLEVQQQLRGAAALASMQDGKWEEEGDFKDKLKNKEESVAIEQDDKIARSEDDVAAMIERLEKQLEAEEHVDTLRKLADYYYRANRFDDSINACNRIVEKMGTLDPAVDRSIEKANVAKFNTAIEVKKAEGGGEAEIQDLENQKFNYRLERAVDRVNKYPNDTELRFNLAVVYWEGSHVDNALEQFQIAQKNPHHRLAAIVYLGRCFHAKDQLDMAIEQFERAISEMPGMDKPKMGALYYLGIAYEDSGNAEKALDCFKQIYQTNVNYMDIAERIQKFYDKKKAEGQ
jgi:tetratricopeptide (TPR) repeat protein